MLHRTARERLIFEARDAPDHVERLQGVRGHTATLERSDTGRARIVRVWHDADLVSWTFSLEPQEDRPTFYPPDLPFIPEMGCEVAWDDETGMVVKWQEQLDADGKERFRQKMDVFRERVEDVTGEPLKPGVRFSPEEAKNLLETMAVPGKEATVASTVGNIVKFHEDAGWSLTSETSSGPFEKVRLKQGEVERSLVAATFGVSLIILEEGGRGSESPDEARAVGPLVTHPSFQPNWGGER